MENSGSMRDFRIYRGKDPGTISFYNLEGTAKADQGELREAINHYSKAIQQNPDDALAYYNRATIKADLGDYTGASEDFKKSVEIDRNAAVKFLDEGISE